MKSLVTLLNKKKKKPEKFKKNTNLCVQILLKKILFKTLKSVLNRRQFKF